MLGNQTTITRRIRILATGLTISLVGAVLVAPTAAEAAGRRHHRPVAGSGVLGDQGRDFSRAEMLSAIPADATAPDTAGRVLTRTPRTGKPVEVHGANSVRGPLARLRGVTARTRTTTPRDKVLDTWLCDEQSPIGVGPGGPGYCDDSSMYPTDPGATDPGAYDPGSYAPDEQNPIQAPTPDPAPQPTAPAGRSWAYQRLTWGTDQSNLVTRTEGRIFWDESDGVHFCSGTVVNTDNQSVVWTAGHCVHSGRGGSFHANWRFVPGYNAGNAPYGQFGARELWSTTQWMQNGGEHGPFLEDFGAAIVGRDSQNHTLMQAVNGGQGILFNQPVDQQFAQVGYPGEGQFDGSTMYACLNQTAEVLAERDGTTPTQIGVGCDMTGGSSGGAWIIGLQSDGVGYVNSVTSNGSSVSPQMHGAYQGADAYALFQAVASR
jgi:V8-like Glu-specific endopeptidase